MDWDGQERRHTQCIHESDWGGMKVSIESLDRRINGSLHEMEKHMDVGNAWRMAILGIIVTIAIQIITFAYLWGGMTAIVDTITRKWEVLEPEHKMILRDVEVLKNKVVGHEASVRVAQPIK